MITPALHEKSFAEVIASSLDHFVAQSWRWNHFPEFGSLVQVVNDEMTIFGCVTHVQTGSMDPMRSPFPYQKTEQELMLEQPQIFEFLQTTFKVQILGHQTSTAQHSLMYILPSKPSKIHSFVSKSTRESMQTFFKKPDFLHLLFAFANQIPNIDELLLALMHQLTHEELLTQDYFESFCETYSLLIGNDYRRMKLFLQRIEQFI